MTVVFGIAMVRNEQDIIGPVLEHMLTQVDHIIIADNMSSDMTREIIEKYPVTLVDDTNPAHEQSKKTTALALRAGHEGADWVVPFDADEIWYSPHYPTIKECLTHLDGTHVAPAAIYNHWSTSLDPQLYNPVKRMGYREQEPAKLHKVACRTATNLVIHEGNHNAQYGEHGMDREMGQLVIRHFPYRSVEQFINKVRQGSAALKRTDLPEGVGIHWRHHGALLEARGPEAIHEIYYEHYWHENPLRDGLIFDPAPVA